MPTVLRVEYEKLYHRRFLEDAYERFVSMFGANV
jgi:hypothetical protein